MDRETNDLIARLYLSEKNLSQVEAREFAVWASVQRGRGRDFEKLRRLAASADSTDVAEAERLFRECLAELKWEMPGRKTTMKVHAESTLRRIVDGELEPYDGCSHLYIVSIYLDHPDYLYDWNEMFWAREDLGVEKLNEMILTSAQRALSGETEEEVVEGDTMEFDTDRPRTFWSHLKGMLGWP